MDDTLEENDDEQEKDDEDDTKVNDDSLMNDQSDTNSVEDDASMTSDGGAQPIIKVDEPEAKKLKGDESLEGDDGMKSETIASYANDLEQSRNDLENDGNSDATTGALNDEGKTTSLKNGRSLNHCISWFHVSAVGLLKRMETRD